MGEQTDDPDYPIEAVLARKRNGGGEGATEAPRHDTENSNERDSELKLLQMHLSKSIPARFGRGAERRAKRERAAEKAITNVVSLKS
ncbi:hypothetical protein AAC387_Pa04g1479 [Persea americana]